MTSGTISTSDSIEEGQNSVAYHEARMEEYLSEFRQLVKFETTWDTPQSLENEYIEKYIRARKYNVEAAAKQLRKSWEFKKKVPDFKDRMYPTKYKGFFENLVSVFKRRSEGRHVLYIQLGKWDPKEMTFNEFLAMLFIVLDEMVGSKETQLHGLLIIIDMKGFTWRHLPHVSPRGLHLIVSMVQDGYPARFKGFHVINNPSVTNVLFAIIKPLLTTKIRRRIFFLGHSYQPHLLNFYGQDLLPEFLGGTSSNENYADTQIFSLLYEKDEIYQNMWAHKLIE